MQENIAVLSNAQGGHHRRENIALHWSRIRSSCSDNLLRHNARYRTMFASSNTNKTFEIYWVVQKIRTVLE